MLDIQNGQNKIKCRIHNYLLITALADSSNCSLCHCWKSKFTCPFKLCSTCICTKCHNELLIEEPDKRYLVIPTSTQEDNSINNSNNREQDDLDNESIESIQSDNSKNELICEVTENEDNQSLFNKHLLDEEESLPDTDNQEIKIVSKDEHDDNLPRTWAADDEEDGLLDGNEYGPDNMDGYDNRIPITNAGKPIMQFHLKAQKGELISNHALLNTMGHLLQRRNQRLNQSRSVQNFLQRFVSTQVGQHIPLLYPEAEMFPNVFWRSDEDGSIPGAIPLCFLQDNAILNNMGIASLLHHIRTRILDPSLLTSTSHKYIAFAWDMVANLGLKGSNVDLVLKRGFDDIIGTNERITMRTPELYDTHSIDSRASVNQLAAANADKRCDYFFTYTCNQKDTLGVYVSIRTITKGYPT